ncbi:DUF423 domain-containing protein [Azospirillum griseum]|uniref:DUF423 domain-containing protein n=1 Tax=Azospirillum griseum TaxID=2496639 RepID=A0A431VL48_9PROT|nr:DUF423 domain-containing protein [Azospirillum griseum]
MDRGFVAFAGVSGAVAVAAAAYGRHALVGDPHAQELFRIAGDQQLWHALALLALGLFNRRNQGAGAVALRGAAGLFATGTLLFCGTLYANALAVTLPIGMTAPLGGVAFIAGWLMVTVAALIGRWSA